MGQAIHTRRMIVRETLLALLVLALTFLNFGHTSVAFAADGHIVTGSSSFCGNPLIPADGDHTPCHACRIGAGAYLPPAPCFTEAAPLTATPVVYAAIGIGVLAIPFRLAASPRAPPAV